MSVVANAATTRSSDSGSLVVQSAVFIALAMAIHAWIDRHLGWGFGSPGILAPLLVTFSAALKLLDWFIGEDAKQDVAKKWAEGLRSRLRSFFNYRVFAVAAAAFLAAALSFASVTITAADARTLGGATVQSQDDSGDCWMPVGSPLRFPCPISAFGSPLRVSVSGYLPETIYVYPFVGATVNVERQLRPAPTVLLRPPAGALPFLERGKLRIQTSAQDAAVEHEGHRGSFLVGRRQSVPLEYVGVWRLELEAQVLFEAPQEDDPTAAQRQATAREREIARTLQEWRRPAEVKTDHPLEPGQTLRAAVVAPNGSVKACIEHPIGPEILQDALMLEESLCKDFSLP